MSEEFFFSLVRISCAQIFRAAGIERCSPSLLDKASDLLVRHLTALSEKASDNAMLSGRNEVVIQDLALAMEELCVIRPRAILDPYDLDPNSFIGYENFIDWVKGPVPEEARRISRIPRVTPIGQKVENTSSGIISISTDGNTGTTPDGIESKDNSDTRAKSEKPEDTRGIDGETRVGSTSSKAPVAASTATKTTSTEASTTQTNTESEKTAGKVHPHDDEEWLTALMKKRIKVGNENKFKGTVLSIEDGLETNPEVKIVGGPVSLDEFQPKNLSVQ
ncbi:Taf3p [Sugiyamaella lignohabitans]|uniref:Taf3p n=1 Tax=Sugiyamaella lignohabitans TaxID=796027 RepID=A0A167F0Q4_9ASCO|nr:Taf3p [Sugiyamaella lignohabitans]ANB14679.1 Taf3p [Sugiyamaella lignohabitans]